MGTNGFHLTFRENHNTTAMGYDYSARGNNFSPSSMSVSNSNHNKDNDSVTDTPTNNFPTWNILRTVVGGDISRANLYAQTTQYQTYPDHFSTMMMPPGKWYCELYVTGGSNGPTVSGGVYLLEDQPASANNYQNSPTTYGTYGGASPGYGNGTLMGVAYDNKLKELIINPDFNYNGDWTKDGSWTIANGKATNSGGGEIYQTISVVNNKTYLMTATIDFTGDSGVDNTSIGFRQNDNSGYFGGASDTTHTPNAVNSVSIEWTANLTGNVRARCYSTDSISITNWSVKEVDATVTFYKNGSLYGSTAMTNVPGMKSYCFGAMGYSYNPDTDRKIFYNANFGQKPFSYTPPTGFVALCSKNIANEFADTTNVGITTGGSYSGKVVIRPQRHFDTLIYTGNGTTGQSITGLEFKPDLVWIKSRSFSNNHHLFDTLRGPDKILRASTNGQETEVTDVMSSFDSNGFTVKEGGGNNATNDDGSTFVAWCWKAGGAPTTTNSASVGSVPTAGSVKIDGVDATAPLAGTRYPDKMSVNTKAGFSIVKYSGTGSAFTLAHGLDRAPDVQLVKTLDGADVSWMFYTKVYNGSQDYMFLDTTAAKGDSGFSGTTDTVFNFNIGASTYSNTNGRNYIMYNWASIPGYSKCFVYTANNSSNGAFFHCGFRPAFIMIKNMDNSSAPWYILDNKRNTENECRISLKANSSAGDVTDSNFIDFLSNGFKMRTSGGYVNGGYQRYFYMAFAEQSGKTEYNLVTNAR